MNDLIECVHGHILFFILFQVFNFVLLLFTHDAVLNLRAVFFQVNTKKYIYFF